VKKLIVLLASTIGGGVGWWLGAFAGMMTAFMVSIIGTALGVYVARRLIAEHLDF